MQEARSSIQQSKKIADDQAAREEGLDPEDEEAMSEKRKKKQLREAGGKHWEDTSMSEWPENDFRLFVGDLGGEVSEELLKKTFNPYPSFVKCKVVRETRSGKSKGYGFLSFLDAKDYQAAFKDWNGKYVGSRPIKLRKSTWKERQRKH